MNNIIIFLTFIPWLLYFTSISKNALKDLKQNKVTKSWIKENIFKIFHFENIILFGIFIYFAKNYTGANQLWLAKVLLFSVINLYLYINRFYDKNSIETKLTTEDISTILLILLITLIPIIFYSSTKMYTTTYYIMFAYSFFNYIIVYIAKFLNELIFKLVKKQNENK